MKSSSWKIVSLLHFLMKIDKLLQLLFLLLELVSITLKKELDIAKIILWAGIILPSSRTRVTSVNWSLCLRSWISFIVFFWNASCCKQNFSITIFLYFEIETRIKFRKSFLSLYISLHSSLFCCLFFTKTKTHGDCATLLQISFSITLTQIWNQNLIFAMTMVRMKTGGLAYKKASEYNLLRTPNQHSQIRIYML